MEKIKALILPGCMLLVQFANAQTGGNTSFVRQGLMDMSTGITIGVMTFNPVQEIYFTSSFAYFFEDQISARTDVNVFLPDYNFEGQLQKNSSILLGPEFHFPAGHFDWSILFEPGMAFPYLKDGIPNKKPQAEPVFNFSLGMYYYFLKHFHLSLSAGYLHGNYFLENSNPFRLDEIRIAGGLGINIFVNHQSVFNRKRVKF